MTKTELSLLEQNGAVNLVQPAGVNGGCLLRALLWEALGSVRLLASLLRVACCRDPRYGFKYCQRFSAQ